MTTIHLEQDEIDYFVALAEGRDDGAGWPEWWEQRREGLRERMPRGCWVRLNRLGPSAASDLLDQLEIPYEKPEPYPGQCSLCGAAITEQRRTGSYDMADGGWGCWYSGLCKDCDVDYHLTTGSNASGGWRPHAPKAQDLQRPLTPEESETFTNIPPPHVSDFDDWRQFLERGRPGDELWWACWPGSDEPFPCRVRAGIPIARFIREFDVSEAELDAERIAKLTITPCASCGLELIHRYGSFENLESLKRVRGWTIDRLDRDALPEGWDAAVIGYYSDGRCPRCGRPSIELSGDSG